MRARYPDTQGTVTVDGVSLGYEIFGDGNPTILLLPTWTIVHIRFWKMQVPYFSRHFRVVTYDGPGNGRSDRPVDPGPYQLEAQAANAVAVMDATNTDRAVLVSLSQGALWSLKLAADVPDRVLGQVFIGPSLPLTPQAPARARIPETFLQEFDDPQGWEKYNAHYWRTNYEGFAEFFFSQCFTEAHSTKPTEDCVRWAMETTPEVLLAEARTNAGLSREDILEMCDAVTSPTLVIHGSDDQVSPSSRGEALAAATSGRLMTLEGSGHIPLVRDPVVINRVIKQFVDRVVGVPA